jgi:asparaginyl-tRNA synthetase
MVGAHDQSLLHCNGWIHIVCRDSVIDILLGAGGRLPTFVCQNSRVYYSPIVSIVGAYAPYSIAPTLPPCCHPPFFYRTHVITTTKHHGVLTVSLENRKATLNQLSLVLSDSTQTQTRKKQEQTMEGKTSGLFRRSYTTVAEIHRSSFEGKEVVVKGHIRASRVQAKAKVTFIELYDGSCSKSLQLVLDHAKHAELWSRVSKDLMTSATIVGAGIVVKSPGVEQPYEIQLTRLEVVGKVVDATTFLPALKGVSLETWRKHADVRPHSRVIQAMYRIRSALMAATHDFFTKHELLRLDPNTITRADCEGAGECFSVTIFDKLATIPTIDKFDHTSVPNDVQPNAVGKEKDGGKEKEREIDWRRDFFCGDGPARLTVSSQLQLEALCHGLGGVWTANPSYRAEPSKTTRHVASFTHIEYELPFVELPALMDFNEDYVRQCFISVLSGCRADLELLDKYVAKGLVNKLQSFVDQPFERITYDRAIELITMHGKAILDAANGLITELPTWGDDLGGVCERYLAEKVLKKPLFVYNYPKALKAFYMKANPISINLPTPPANQADQKQTVGQTVGSQTVGSQIVDSQPVGGQMVGSQIVDSQTVGGQMVWRQTVASCDLLIPYLGELIGSSVREDDFDKLTAEIKRRNMDPKPLEWYTNLRKNASVPSGGAGLGFDRLVVICTSMDHGHIKDAIPFPVAYQDLQF